MASGLTASEMRPSHLLRRGFIGIVWLFHVRALTGSVRVALGVAARASDKGE